MPTLGEKIKRKRKVTGYKVAIRDGGRYRSLTTWNVYQAGKNIGKFKYDPKKERVEEVPFPLQNMAWFCYKKEYNGYTSIFKEEKSANLSNIGIGGFWAEGSLPHEIVVLEMTISGDLREGNFGKSAIFIGKKIEDFKEIKVLHYGKNSD